jgi:hypothetical protein
MRRVFIAVAVTAAVTAILAVAAAMSCVRVRCRRPKRRAPGIHLFVLSKWPSSLMTCDASIAQFFNT